MYLWLRHMHIKYFSNGPYFKGQGPYFVKYQKSLQLDNLLSQSLDIGYSDATQMTPGT